MPLFARQLIQIAGELLAAATFVILALGARAYDVHFDYTSFDNANTPGANPHFGQAQFNVLNYPSINGNYMMTSTDNHRPEMVANNNNLAEFYNNFLADYNTQYNSVNGLDPTAEADAINSYTVKNSTKNGPKPTWLILNEISFSVWPNSTQKGADYRKWVIDSVTRLHDVYGFSVVTYAPLANPSGFASDWQALAAKSYIGVENYLSGEEVMSHGTDYASRVAWAQAQYAWSKTAYGSLGVDSSRLFLGEEFANTASGVGWGRAGLSISDWDSIIQIRQDAIYNADYAGYLAYAWGSNPLLISESEQIEFEYYYRTRRVLHSQKPQWLSDSAINVNGTTHPLSWSDQLNWLGGVPNAAGAEVNFWRTLTSNRTITLDGSKTLGKLLFDSPFNYTISPGTGGSLIFNNSSSAATLTSNQGSHTIATGVQLTSNLTATINTGIVTISGAISGTGALTKAGAGTLALTGTNSYTGITAVQAGKLSLTNPGLADSADVFVSNGGLLDLQFSGAADVIDSLFLNGISQPVGTWGPIGSGAEFTTSLLLGTGWLQVNTYVPSFLAGDYNSNGIVDTSDYIVWRRSVGAASIANRDPNNSGPVGAADFDTWRLNLGRMVGGASGAGASLAGAVPEPAAACLLSLLVMFVSSNWRPARSERFTV